MEEQANKILVELLQKAVGGIDAAVSFSQAQIPDIVHQLLVWNFAQSMIATLIGIVLICASPLIAKSILSTFGQAKIKDGSWTVDQSFDFVKNMSFPAFIVLVFCAGGFIVSIIVVVNNMDWLKILLAPKLYLLEYAASLIK
ncbi:hypothetical protein ACTM6E_27230 [Citrobacter freundii]